MLGCQGPSKDSRATEEGKKEVSAFTLKHNEEMCLSVR
jgi:hypothetical protein